MKKIYVIYNQDEDAYWSNDEGWVDIESADKFTLAEKMKYNLPLGGEWLEYNQKGTNQF